MQGMTWVAGGLALLLLWSVTLYYTALKQTRHLLSLVALILADEETYARHRLWLAELVRSIDAGSLQGLNFRVWRALDEFAMKMNGPATAAYVANRLWTLKLRQREQQQS